MDTATGLPIREYRSNFTAGTLPAALPEALTATVAAAFHLPRAAAVETVSAAAAPAYATANSLLRTDGSKGPAAAAAFEQAIALDPASPLPRAGFAEAAFNAWRSTQDATWLTRGREQLAQAIERSPDSLSVHLAAGKLSLAPGAYERAREEFQRATQIEPDSAEAWRGLALAYESMTGYENEAAAAYLKASQVHDLLTMTCGHDIEPKRPQGEDSWVKTFLAHPVPHNPGTTFLYNSFAMYGL